MSSIKGAPCRSLGGCAKPEALSEDLHIAVVALLCEVIPEGAKVVFLGDEFDGTALQDTLNKMGWSYVCRTAMSTTATWDGQTFRLDTLGACLKPGGLIEPKMSTVPKQRMVPSWSCAVGPKDIKSRCI